MIIINPNGQIRKTAISDCTGYVATCIMLEPRDIDHLLIMLQREPLKDVTAMLVQLRGRYASERPR